ncbi:FAD-binding domain-containing protein [Pedobacter jamesrossensis]|uniref:FAD-binding domain-containing protein n=1 Tax=Pedobacter jamesrossensis TaxID=1908238 RepID=A0ABV8NSV5_9SPHI
MEEISFNTDYKAILERVATIDPLNYARTRNFINGGVSYLSPYISRGVISLPEVARSALHNGPSAQSAEKFIQELAWREYYQQIWQARQAHIWQDLRHPQPDVQRTDMISAIAKANTGIISIDEQINSLFITGYMHNHVRMYLASITCNIAKAHWILPSKWMYYHLLDGDIASNNCSWQWVAGAFANKKYYCNQENINMYTMSTQQGTFLDRPYEQLPEMPIPEILKEGIAIELITKLPNTSLPIIDTSRPTIIYNSYNLDPMWRKDQNANRVLLLEPSHFDRFPVSEKVIGFIQDLSRNIPSIQIYAGEIAELQALYSQSGLATGQAFISKDHPAFNHYPGTRDSYERIFPEVTGEYPSFFSYWKRCRKYLDNL